MNMKNDTLKIGGFVYDTLKDDLRVFPILADKGTDYPFAVFRRTGAQPRNTKDIYDYVTFATIEVVICAKTYTQSLELAVTAKDKLEHFRGEYKDLYITDVTLTNANEDWVNDAFIQRLYFKVDIDNSIR